MSSLLLLLLLELQFQIEAWRAEYRREREHHAPWIDHGGEG